MHNLQLTEDQTLILDTVRKYVQEAVAPKALEHDEHWQFAAEEFAGLAEIGLFGLPVGEAAGGTGMGFLPLAVAAEAIAESSGSLARLLAGQIGCALALEAAGAAAPLGDVIAGSKLAAFVGAEHGVTAAAGKLTGKAELVTGAGQAALFVVACKQDGKPALAVVDAGAVQRAPVRSLGFRSTAPCRVEFAGAAATIVATGADAEKATRRAQLGLWIAGAAFAVGTAAAACSAAKKHASERIAFGKPLLVQQAVARKLVETRRAADAARHLTFHAARLGDLGQDAASEAMQARVAAVDAAVLAADEAIQIHGGYGYVVEYHVERNYRDAKTQAVLDFTNDQLRDRLAALQYSV
jgi:alkylation response protein AidB-like acyl-CoA dehydrogenase